MTDRLDARIQALVVELVGDPPPPPPFPGIVVIRPERRPRVSRRSGVAVAVAGLAAVLIALFMARPPAPQPIASPTEADVVAALVDSITLGDLQGALEWFDEDLECFIPGDSTCQDLFGFFVAADGAPTISRCEPGLGSLYNCEGYLHTSIHEAMGITAQDLSATPNFWPSFIIEDGVIKRFTMNSPFTGDQALDGALWQYLLDTGASFVDADGTPVFSADIVAEFAEAAARFAEARER